jgi:hypothetical protein
MKPKPPAPARQGEKPSAPTAQPAGGKIWGASAIFSGEVGGRADAGRSVQVLIDDPPPPSAQDWLESAVDRLKSTPDCPQRVTDAARRLEKEMAEAFLRRQCDEAMVSGAIKNSLITKGLWPRTRPLKR